MITNRDIALIDELRQQPAESEWLEFKHDNVDPEMIGARCLRRTIYENQFV
jgi:ATP-dependent DNA helicase RecG